MASRYWIKLYHEILDDPKMGRLPHRTWRRAIEMFLLAGDCEDDGRLPDVGDIAWRLRADPDELAEDFQRLAEVEIIAQDEAGWYVVHFSERQAPVPTAERVRQYRKRQRIEQFEGPDTEPEQEGNDENEAGNGSETIRYTDIDIDADIDTEYVTVNQLAHEYSPLYYDEKRIDPSADPKNHNIIVDKEMYNKLVISNE